MELPQGIATSSLSWGEKIEGNARDILGVAEQTEDDRGQRSAIRETEDFLRGELASGPVPVPTIYQHASAAGITRTTLRRA
jgi:putative DNA primase/helicase